MEKSKKTKKETNKLIYTIGMIIFFVLVQELIIWGYGSSTILAAIIKYPKGDLVLTEVVLSGLCLILMLLFGNSYVFTEKREKFTLGLFYGMYYIIGSAIFMLSAKAGFKEFMPLINLLIGCFFIGICEEFLCRGFLLNEFLERFGKNKKGVWYSIIISGVIFGVMHIFNAFGGQSLTQTLGQVVSASTAGIMFGIIYYKTKNIWSVIFLHSLWDFSVMLTDIIPQTEAIELIEKNSIFTILMILVPLIQLLLLIPFKEIDKKPKTAELIVCSVAAFFGFLFLGGIFGILTTKVGKTYKYNKIKIDNYLEIYENVEKYNIKEQTIYLSLEEDDDNNLIIKNNNTNYMTKIECDNLIDYSIIEFEDSYIISYVDNKDGRNNYLYYKEIKKGDIKDNNYYVENLGKNFNRYLLPGKLRIKELYDYDKEKKYLAVYDQDYGMYLLNNNKLSKLENY